LFIFAKWTDTIKDAIA